MALLQLQTHRWAPAGGARGTSEVPLSRRRCLGGFNGSRESAVTLLWLRRKLAYQRLPSSKPVCWDGPRKASRTFCDV